MRLTILSFCFFIGLGLQSCAPGTSVNETNEKEINVYSQRHYEIDKKVFDQFTKETGIRVNLITSGADELLAKLESEAELSPCDLFLAVDAGNLYKAKTKGLLQAYTSKEIIENVLPNFRDLDGYWTGLTMRARVIVVDKELADFPKRYEDFARPEFKSMVLSRSSSSSYNQSLLASMIAYLGDEKASLWAKAVKENFARDPNGNDRDQVKDIALGKGKMALVNTYYLGKMQNSTDPSDLAALEAVRIIFPNQDDRGTHINVSGAGLCKYAKHPEEAKQLLNYLVRKNVQYTFAANNEEYPVDGRFLQEGILAKLGPFKVDTLSLMTLGQLNTEAVKIFDKVGWK